MRRSMLVPAVLALFVSACGSAAGSVAPASAPAGVSSPPIASAAAAPTPTAVASTAPTPSATAAPTPSPTAVATASAAPSASATAGGALQPGPVSPGTYTTTVTGTPMTFTVDSAGWIAETRPDGWALSSDTLGGGLSLVPFVGQVFSDPCSGEKTTKVAKGAASFVKQIQSNKQLKVGKPVAVKLAGQRATQVDMTADVPPACSGNPRIWLWVMPQSGDFHLDENENARMIAADVGDKTFVTVLETFQGGDQAGLISATKGILDSLRIQ